MAKLQDDIKSALMYGMNPSEIKGKSQEEVISEKSELLSNAIKEFLSKQEFRITEMEVPLDVEHIKTSSPIDADVKSDTLMGPNMVYIMFFKSVLNDIKDVSVGGISPFSVIVDPILGLIDTLESKLKVITDKVSGGGSTIPSLFLKDGKDGGDLDVKGVSVMSEKSGGDSPSKLSKKSIIKLFKNDIKRMDK